MIGDTPAPAAPYAVEGHALVKAFGDFRAVDGVDIAVPAGTIYGILGPNGAGKTTFVKLMTGELQPTSVTQRGFLQFLNLNLRRRRRRDAAPSS